MPAIRGVDRLTEAVRLLYDTMYIQAYNEPMHADALKRVLEVGERQLRDVVAILRCVLRGGTVVSGNDGYELTCNVQKMIMCRDRLVSHSKSQLFIAGAITRAIDFPEQLRLDVDRIPEVIQIIESHKIEGRVR